jgi:hypothetical protein
MVYSLMVTNGAYQFDGKPIVTNQSTTVWINATEGVSVPARMVLGTKYQSDLATHCLKTMVNISW